MKSRLAILRVGWPEPPVTSRPGRVRRGCQASVWYYRLVAPWLSSGSRCDSGSRPIAARRRQASSAGHTTACTPPPPAAPILLTVHSDPSESACPAPARASAEAAKSPPAESFGSGSGCWVWPGLHRRRLEGPHGNPLVIRSPSLWAVPVRDSDGETRISSR